MRPWRVGAAVAVIAVLAAILAIAQDGPQPPQPVEAMAAAPAPIPARPYRAVWPRPAPAPAVVATPSPDEEVDPEPRPAAPASPSTTVYEGMHPVDLEAGSGDRSTEASFYTEAEGTSTASGIPLDDSAFTAAHRTLAFGTVLSVCYRGSCVRVTVTDRGPYIGGRDIDLSLAAFVALAGGTGPGVIDVTWSEVG